MQRSGQCLCGSVRFTVSTPPIATRTCWCRLCQYIGAGSATVNAGFYTKDVQIEGKTTTYTSTADSGATLHRSFCPTCGTPLFSAAAERPHMLFIRVGAFDQRDDLGPAISIWTTQAPTWACIDPTLPTNPAQPPPAA